MQILKELRIDGKKIDFIVRIYVGDSTKIQLEKNKEIEIEVTSGIRQPKQQSNVGTTLASGWTLYVGMTSAPCWFLEM